MGEPRYEERDPQTAVDSLLAAATAGNAGAGRLYKRRRHYISKKSSGAEEEDDNGEAEGASNELDKRRNLYQLINRLQARRVCVGDAHSRHYTIGAWMTLTFQRVLPQIIPTFSLADHPQFGT